MIPLPSDWPEGWSVPVVEIISPRSTRLVSFGPYPGHATVWNDGDVVTDEFAPPVVVEHLIALHRATLEGK